MRKQKEVIVIDTDDEVDGDGDGGVLALCGEVNVSLNVNTLADLDYDLDYRKYLANFSENHLYLLEDNVRDSNSPRRLKFEEESSKKRVVEKAKSVFVKAGNEPKSHKSENCRAYRKSVLVKEEKSNKAGRKPRPPLVLKRVKTENVRYKENDRAVGISKFPSVSSVSKRVKIENGKADHKSTLRTVEIRQKTRDSRREKKKVCEKESKERSRKRKSESNTIFRASKRVKTEIDFNNEEAPLERKIHLTEAKPISHVKEKILNSSEARKKVNEETVSAIDKSYAYYMVYLRNSITVFKPDQKAKPVEEDLVCLSDPDIIAISDHPFSDGDVIPFVTDKDDKVLDVEDGIEHDDMFNSSFGNKLMEILKKPYDENERLELCYEIKHKRPLTRSRQLRDGREIEYNVDNQLAQSYLEQYTDFKKKFRRHKKDRPRALNLLRGFFFYFQNIVHEGAFKPWTYEKRLENMCLDGRGCKEIECIKQTPPATPLLKYLQ